MSGRASEYKKGKMTNEERKARLKQRCMDDVASKRAKLVRSLRNAPGSVSQVGHAIVESMQSEDPGVDPDDPHAGLTEAEYQELMSSLEVALVVRGPTPPAFQLPPSQSHTRSTARGFCVSPPCSIRSCSARACRGWSKRRSEWPRRQSRR